MKRHEALQPLSRDHHDALVLARSLVRDATDTDATTDTDAPSARAREVRLRFERDLEPHFRIEERWLFPVLRERGAPELAARAVEDHRRLREMVAGSWSDTTPGELGRLLERHVRFEERELFPAAEKLPGRDELARIEAASVGESRSRRA